MHLIGTEVSLTPSSSIHIFTGTTRSFGGDLCTFSECSTSRLGMCIHLTQTSDKAFEGFVSLRVSLTDNLNLSAVE